MGEDTDVVRPTGSLPHHPEYHDEHGTGLE